MGMSASQARLLTLTARLNRNEYRAQQISNAKIRLAQSTEDASDAYIQALNATNLTYTTYDESGNKNTQQLTGGAIYTYSSIKNQYGFVNAAGQLMVTEKDGGNFENSKTLTEFLEKYGIEKVDSGKTKTVTNPAYQAEYENWQKQHNEWATKKPDSTDAIYWKDVPDTDNELYKTFREASESCYNHAINNNTASCYLHVLGHMIDLETTGNGHADNSKYPKYKTTTTGGQIELIAGDSTYGPSESINYSAICVNKKKTEDMLKVSDAIRDGYKGKTLMAAAHPSEELGTDATNTDKLISDYYLKQALENGTVASESQQLLSNYKYTYDDAGNITGIEQKTLYQKCIDLYDVVNRIYKHSDNPIDVNYETTKEIITSFQDDMSLAFTKSTFQEEDYNKDLSEWEAQEPKMKEDISQTIEEKIYTYSDSDEAQWYINLWHRMNGESDYKAGYMNETEYDSATDGWVTDSKTGQSYAILEDGLMNDPEWIAFALKNSVITMEQVQYSNPNEAGTGLKNVAWTSIVYTSMTEMSEETSEKKRTKAEVIYEQAQRDIEELDKKYDSDLKQLDTEHNALQTEYESIQNVINKNVERTFKTFS